MYQYKKILGAVFAAIALSANLAAKKQEPKKNILTVTYIDVGQGDSILIETPEGKNILIDAGDGPTDWSSWDAGDRIVVPFLKKRGIKKLDYVLMSHAHNDHIGGLPAVLKAFPVDTFVDPGFQYNSYIYENLLTLVEEKGCKYVEARAGGQIKRAHGGPVQQDAANKRDQSIENALDTGASKERVQEVDNDVFGPA